MPYITQITPEQWVDEFRAWVQSHSGDDLPLLADEAISREFIYQDRVMQMLVLVDSNVLLRSLHPGRPYCAAVEFGCWAQPPQRDFATIVSPSSLRP